MAFTISALSMAAAQPSIRATQKRVSSSGAVLKHSPMAVATKRPNATFQIKADADAASSSSSIKEKAVTVLTAAAVTTSMVIPEVAHAADGVTPSLKNFLLSITAGGVVVVAIIGAVIGVSNFDPVKRS